MKSADQAKNPLIIWQVVDCKNKWLLLTTAGCMMVVDCPAVADSMLGLLKLAIEATVVITVALMYHNQSNQVLFSFTNTSPLK